MTNDQLMCILSYRQELDGVIDQLDVLRDLLLKHEQIQLDDPSKAFIYDLYNLSGDLGRNIEVFEAVVYGE